MKGEEEVQKYKRILSFFQYIFSRSELVIRKNILFMNAKDLIVTFLYIIFYIKFISFLLKILSNQKSY